MVLMMSSSHSKETVLSFNLTNLERFENLEKQFKMAAMTSNKCYYFFSRVLLCIGNILTKFGVHPGTLIKNVP